MSAEAPRMPRSSFGRGRVHAVAGCRFVASFAAPALPPYPSRAAPAPTGGDIAVPAVTLPPLKFRTRWSR